MILEPYRGIVALESKPRASGDDPAALKDGVLDRL